MHRSREKPLIIPIPFSHGVSARSTVRSVTDRLAKPRFRAASRLSLTYTRDEWDVSPTPRDSRLHSRRSYRRSYRETTRDMIARGRRVAARECSCIDWSMRPRRRRRRRVINHLAPVSTGCTSFPLAVCIARATPLKGSEERKERKGEKKPRSLS